MSVKQVIAGALCATGFVVLATAAFVATTETRTSDQKSPPLQTSAIPQEGATAPDGQSPGLTIASVWQDWMARYGVSDGAMAIGQNGQIDSSEGTGRGADIPYPVASLSKAITAICLQTILLEDKLDWGATLAETLGPATPTPVADLTIGALLTHTSGLAPDLTQGNIGNADFSSGSMASVARAALGPDGTTGNRGDFFYSNTNYAVLGQVIEVLSGKPYAETCMDRVMTPAGITSAAVGGEMASTGAYGGWQVSATDYARFAMYWFGPDRPWVKLPEAYPLAANGYGLGVYNINGVITHAGRWNMNDDGRDVGAIFVIDPEGRAFAANWRGALPPAAYDDLIQRVLALK